jgi:hypothetical protein
MFRTFRDCCADASASFLLLGSQRRHKQKEARPRDHTTRPPLLYHLSICYTILEDLSGNGGIRSNLKVDDKSVAYFSHRPETIAKRNVTKCLDTVYSTINGANDTQKFRLSQLHMGQFGPRLVFS